MVAVYLAALNVKSHFFIAAYRDVRGSRYGSRVYGRTPYIPRGGDGGANVMRKIAQIFLVVLSVLLAASRVAAAEREQLKPFVLGSVQTGELETVLSSVKSALEAQGFQVVGEYVPYDNAHVVVVTSDELKRLAGADEGALFAVGQRVSVTKVGDQIQVAYVNPEYLFYAYRMKASMGKVIASLKAALGNDQTFGAKGVSPSKLRKYHYAFGMEYFDDVYQLARFPDYASAVSAVEKGLSAGKYGVTKVYRIDIPGEELSVFGVAMKAPAEKSMPMDDTYQMGVVDHQDLKQTAYLPYEVVVKGNKVQALHMRFRMAVHFPDLRMVGDHSFLQLVSSPEAIEKALTLTVGGRWIEDF